MRKHISDGLKRLFKGVMGEDVERIEVLPGAGSSRRYYRLIGDDGKSVIGVYGDDVRENEAFCLLAGRIGGLAPEVFGMSDDRHIYIQEDLGDTALFSLLGKDGSEEMIEKALRRLPEVQCTEVDFELERVIERPFCRRQILWDLNYFKYEFVKPCGVALNEDLLEDDFEKFAERLLDVTGDCIGFMYRDFQSRNVMVKDGEPRFIDFQGGRIGPVLYDAVSFLWQAKARFPDDFRRRMIDVYADSYCERRGVDKEVLLRPLDEIILFRTLQVLGAYGFRGLVERKAHFIESIPYALENLRGLVDGGVLKGYPELERVCREICSQSRWAQDDWGGLTVKVFSFSYKKGYPEDLTGNGGGFMFDCRAMHNPGRYAEYKRLTGLDGPVKSFLEERGEIQPFIEHALGMVVPAVERYLKRGFGSLQIGFGCTGGQHRSVYSAQKVAERLAGLFPEVRIDLLHREQGVHTIYNNTISSSPN